MKCFVPIAEAPASRTEGKQETREVTKKYTKLFTLWRTDILRQLVAYFPLFLVIFEVILKIFVTGNSFFAPVYDHHDGSGAQSPNPRREKGKSNTLLLKF